METASREEVLKLSCDLINKRSITPDDAGCQTVLAERLGKIGFQCEHMPFGKVKNLWARLGTASPLFVFAGHTDVVPPGPENRWQSPPFQPTITNGKLFGRGAADMKTAIAAMVTATERYLQNNKPKGSIAFLITSDEEGAGIDGTAKVIEQLQARGEIIDYCIVGEATGLDTVCDTIKNGRRGSLTGKLTVHGVQGHIAYPERAANPIHLFARCLADLCTQQWDDGNEHFSPTSFQFSNLNSGTGADNVIPAELTATFNFRFSSESTPETLKEKIETLLRRHALNYSLEWHLSGKPFLTRPGRLTQIVEEVVKKITGRQPALSTSGGTSDARFIAPAAAQTIELGLVNATIHQIDEHAAVADIIALSSIYQQILSGLL